MSELKLTEVELIDEDGDVLITIHTPLGDTTGSKMIRVGSNLTTVTDKNLEEFCIKMLLVLGYKIRS